MPRLACSSLCTLENESPVRRVLAAEFSQAKPEVSCPEVAPILLFWSYKEGSHQQHYLAIQLYFEAVEVPCSTTAVLLN